MLHSIQSSQADSIKVYQMEVEQKSGSISGLSVGGGTLFGELARALWRGAELASSGARNSLGSSRSQMVCEVSRLRIDPARGASDLPARRLDLSRTCQSNSIEPYQLSPVLLTSEPSDANTSGVDPTGTCRSERTRLHSAAPMNV